MVGGSFCLGCAASAVMTRSTDTYTSRLKLNDERVEAAHRPVASNHAFKEIHELCAIGGA